MRSPMVEITHGFVIVRANGRAVDGHLYPQRHDAEMVNAFLGSCSVSPARRVVSFRKLNGTSVKLRSEIVIDRETA